MVLLVEDSRELAANLEIALKSMADTDVRVAMGVGQAMALLEGCDSARPLVIVTDIRLPDRDGLDWIRQLRASATHEDTPVVVVSGETDPTLAASLAALRVRAFFRKPFSPLVLKNQIESIFAESVS